MEAIKDVICKIVLTIGIISLAAWAILIQTFIACLISDWFKKKSPSYKQYLDESANDL